MVLKEADIIVTTCANAGDKSIKTAYTPDVIIADECAFTAETELHALQYLVPKNL